LAEATSGTVVIPLLGRSRPIAMDGRMVWPKNGRASGITAVERNGAVHFSGITGSHTFAWGNVDHRD
jgi:alpha-L-rhamnosidase